MKREFLIYFTTLTLLSGFYLLFKDQPINAQVKYKVKRKLVQRIFPFLLVFIFGYLVIYTIIKSVEISLAIALLFLFIPYLQEKSRASKRSKSIRSAWPEFGKLARNLKPPSKLSPAEVAKANISIISENSKSNFLLCIWRLLEFSKFNFFFKSTLNSFEKSASGSK